tara:strand:- start:104 stop:454 length:351 start_codon:yes stop_codon:yes gene_type:complete
MATHYEFITTIDGGSGVDTFNCSDIFSARYNIYFLNYKYEGQSSTGYIAGRLLDSGGSAITDSEYANAAVAMRSYNTFLIMNRQQVQVGNGVIIKILVEQVLLQFLTLLIVVNLLI